MPELEDVINEFLPLCESDAEMLNFARKRKITVHYLIPDAQIQFFMVFQDGTVSCGGGLPPSPAHFTITMNQKTFEAVMSGQADGTAAALSGDIKFKGDPMKALTLQKINPFMNRLWLETLKKYS